MTERPLADVIKPDLSEARLTRQWDAIRSRTGPARSRTWVWGALALAVAAVALAVSFGEFEAPEPVARSAWDGATVESQTEPVTVRLKDGSRIDLQQQSRLEVVERRPQVVQLQLRKGQARFDVAKDPERVFSVKAENVTVRVIGTRFVVAIDEDSDGRHVRVAVERGVVEAAEDGERVTLRAGQSWSSRVEAAAVQDEPVPTAEPSATATPAPRAAPQPTPAPVEAPIPSSARELFEEGNVARRAGDLALAADRYRALLREHPSDARVGVAAFELGRLLQDRFGDPSGAASALKRCIGSSAGASFREDAMARLVRAYATMGASKQCEQARSAYLKSYPGGVHVAAVRRACGGEP